jgi:hypothetical protein
MKIESGTRLNFHPRKKESDEESGLNVAFYDVMVGDEKLGVTEVVASVGTKVTVTLETEDGQRFQKHELSRALEHAGHEVVT